MRTRLSLTLDDATATAAAAQAYAESRQLKVSIAVAGESTYLLYLLRMDGAPWRAGHDSPRRRCPSHLRLRGLDRLHLSPAEHRSAVTAGAAATDVCARGPPGSGPSSRWHPSPGSCRYPAGPRRFSSETRAVPQAGAASNGKEM